MVDIDPVTGAPVIKPFTDGDTHKVTTLDGPPPITNTKGPDESLQTPNQGQSPKVVEYPNTVETLEKKCSDLQEVLTMKNEEAHVAHQNLMNAQRELLYARAH